MKNSASFLSRRRPWSLPLLAVVLGAAVLGGGRLLNGQGTDLNGQIVGDNWLILGPFSNPFACSGIADNLLGNHIGPSHIACEFPGEDDEIDYDPGQSVSTGYVGPTGPGGGPVWRAFSDGGSDGDQNLDGDVGGDLTDVMSWLVTYIEYAGDATVVTDLCIGSDDDVQVWVDDLMVHNFAACRARLSCQDIVPAVITPGVHRIALGVWENEGGWGGMLALRLGGVPIVDDGSFPDWIFLGREGEVTVPNCQPPPPPGTRVQNLSCSKRLDGGVDVTWQNPPGANTGVPIALYGAGEFIRTVPGTSTSATVAAADIPNQGASISVVNDSGLAASCSAIFTDANGLIKTSRWLALGPFTHPFGCNGNNASLQGNHIAPSCIQGQYPEAGDEIAYDPGPAVTTSYTGPTGPGGMPVWRNFDDGSDDGLQNFESDTAVPGAEDVMTWIATYVEYKGDAPVDIEICSDSDDGVQVWFNDLLVHNNNACRGISNPCIDRTPVNGLLPGVYCIKTAAWDRGGGWAVSFGMQLGGQPILDEPSLFPDWTFWGRTKPPGFQDIPCPACLEPVSNVTCQFGPVGFGTGLIINWTNPPACATPELAAISIQVNGIEVGTVPPTATQAQIPESSLPAGAIVAAVVNSSGFPVECCPAKTDDAGIIRSQHWLVLGPFQEPFGCNGDNNSILENHIGPSHICEQYPVAGDEVEYDPLQSATTAYVGPTNQNGSPFWRAFDDGTPCNGDNDLDADQEGGPQTDAMSWMATYIEYTGVAPIDLTLCTGSDDGVQIWIDDLLVHNNNACRGRTFPATCQDNPLVTLDPGVHCFKIAAWENDGGWGLSLGLQEAGLPIVDDGSRDDFVFHGKTRPVPVNQFPTCTVPCPPVEITNCSLNGQGALSLAWTNPPCETPPAQIAILLNGTQAGSVAGNATSFTVPPASVPEGVVKVVIDNGAFRPTYCGVLNGNEGYINCGGGEFTDSQGRVWSEDSLGNPSGFLTGPNAFAADFGNPLGVNLTADPVVAEREFPAEIFPVERWNDGPIEYTISGFPAGDYELTLLFMEGCCSDLCEDIPDPALSAGTCRVFDIYVNDNLVDDQFSQNVVAAGTAGVAPGVTANYIAIARVYNLTAVSSVKIRIEDLGAGDPPQNASIKGICLVPAGGVPPEVFHRGDTTADGNLNITDGVNIFNWLFLGGTTPICLEAANPNDAITINITSGVYLLNFLFLGGPAPPPPGPPTTGGNPCGPDPANSPSHLGCNTYNGC